MATGPEHYCIAEALLAVLPLDAPRLEEARVHATLALVAATAPRGSGEWQAVVAPTEDEQA